jgi:signal transduction histidine kinase
LIFVAPMPPEDKQPNPEREQTDESLRIERQKADDVLGDRLAAIEETADTLIDTARARADAVLAEGRARIDRGAATRPTSAQSTRTLDRERRVEDKVVREERADADETVRAERAELAAVLVTERVETDKDLSHERSRSDSAVATRDDFLGIVSHDLRNMLTGIVGFAGLIAKAESGETPHRADQVLAHARRIQRSGARMNRLIGDLVDVASIEAGMLGVTRQLGDPCHVVMEAIEIFHAQAAAGGVSLVTEIATAPLLTSFDPARILQVLVNLLSNAIKFTPAGGKVVVRVDRVAEELRFAVHDTGVGIPADGLEAVFERFRQMRKDDRRGVGLGLYISKCIVQGHGGRIWAESRAGEGSTFWFTLPMSQREDEELPAR